MTRMQMVWTEAGRVLWTLTGPGVDESGEADTPAVAIAEARRWVPTIPSAGPGNGWTTANGVTSWTGDEPIGH